LKTYFVEMARYNAWANRRLYAMAANLSDEAFHRDVGAFFKSLCGTLNHLLTADRIWMRRLTGYGDHPTTHDVILFEHLADLTSARVAEDQRIIDYIDALSVGQLEGYLDYQTLNGTAQTQRLRGVLAHLFNHQTHHRGQAHGILSSLGAHPIGLDLLIMQREIHP
jgi:uncharacterized damage-inducible protein DinB